MQLMPDPAHPLSQPVERIASRALVHLSGTDSLSTAARRLVTAGVPFLPVLDDQGRALGVVTEAGLLAVWCGAAAADAPVTAVLTPMLAIDGRLLFNLSALAGRHRVPTVMRTVITLVRPVQTLREVAALMASGADPSVVVVEGGRPVGVVTAHDATRLLAEDASAGDRPLQAVMGQPVLTLAMDATLNEAADRMLQHRVHHLVVVAPDGQLVGMLNEHDLARSMAMGLMDASIVQERVRHRAILDAIPDLVWLKDPHGVYLACTPR
ncbi:MAG: hypothetical protein CFE45_25015, partial [Burkholderiales bacterium PBB5]